VSVKLVIYFIGQGRLVAEAHIELSAIFHFSNGNARYLRAYCTGSGYRDFPVPLPPSYGLAGGIFLCYLLFELSILADGLLPG